MIRVFPYSLYFYCYYDFFKCLVNIHVLQSFDRHTIMKYHSELFDTTKMTMMTTAMTMTVIRMEKQIIFFLRAAH